MYPHKGVNGDKIQAMSPSHYFFFCQAALLGVSDHCVKIKCMPCPHVYIFKLLWTGFHILHWIHKSYGIKIPTIGRSCSHCPPCLQMRIRGGVGMTIIVIIIGPIPMEGGGGGLLDR